MTNKRGNPNWGRPMPPVSILCTEFEMQVRNLHLAPAEYVVSAELRKWCKENKNRARRTPGSFQYPTPRKRVVRNVRRKLNQILKKLHLAPAGLHAFRHGRVSVLQENGVPVDLVVDLVKEWVGHSNLRTTSRHTHFRDDFCRQVASDAGLFSQGKVAEDLQFSPNSPNLWKSPSQAERCKV